MELVCNSCLIPMICDACSKHICHQVNEGCMYTTYYVFNVDRKTIVLCEDCARDASLKKRE